MKTLSSPPILSLGSIAALMALLSSCGGVPADTTLPAPIETTLDRVADYVGQRVAVEGYLVTDSSIGCPDSVCWLWLTSEPLGDDGATYGTPDLFVNIGIPQDWGFPYPNTIADVPFSWSPSDIVVRSEDLEEVHLNDRIRVTGWVEVDENGYTRLAGLGRPCGDMRGGEERRRLVEAFECPDTGFVIELLAP